jgi:hypothetical protein
MPSGVSIPRKCICLDPYDAVAESMKIINTPKKHVPRKTLESVKKHFSSCLSELLRDGLPFSHYFFVVMGISFSLKAIIWIHM